MARHGLPREVTFSAVTGERRPSARSVEVDVPLSTIAQDLRLSGPPCTYIYQGSALAGVGSFAVDTHWGRAARLTHINDWSSPCASSG